MKALSAKLRPDSQPTQFCTGGVTDHFRPTEFAVVFSHSKWYFGGTMSSTLLHPPSMEGFAMTFQRERERSGIVSVAVLSPDPVHVL